MLNFYFVRFNLSLFVILVNYPSSIGKKSQIYYTKIKNHVKV